MATKKKVKKKVVEKKTIKKKVSKKRTIKKSFKKKKSVKKVVDKKIVSKSPSLGKNDFETFKFGVQRLRELKMELDSLDTRGFGKETQAIRVKLKNVSEIPNLEKAIKGLKLKIGKKYRPKKRRKSHAKEISENIEDIKGAIKGLRRSKKESAKEIKGAIQSLKRSKKDSFEDIKKEIRKIKKDSKPTGPVDSGVDILVDTNFNAFLGQTKRALSDRIKRREQELDETLRIDLERREGKYKQKHDNLLREFQILKEKLEKGYETKYKVKVKSSLHKEIAEKFNRLLNEKINKEKTALGKVYKSELRVHADEALQMHKRKLQRTFDKGKSNLEKQKQRIKIHLESEGLRLKDNYERDESRLRDNLEKEKKTYKDEFERDKSKLKWEGSKFKDDFEKNKERLQDNYEKSRENMKSKLRGIFNSKVAVALAKKEKNLRKRLSNEYELRLKRKIQEHESELKKEKLNLELEMQKKIKQVLS